MEWWIYLVFKNFTSFNQYSIVFLNKSIQGGLQFKTLKDQMIFKIVQYFHIALERLMSFLGVFR